MHFLSLEMLDPLRRRLYPLLDPFGNGALRATCRQLRREVNAATRVIQLQIYDLPHCKGLHQRFPELENLELDVASPPLPIEAGKALVQSDGYSGTFVLLKCFCFVGCICFPRDE